MHTLRTQSRTESVFVDLNKTGEFNTFSEESNKTIPKTWKDRIIWIERSFYENTASVLRQMLTRRTGDILTRSHRAPSLARNASARLVRWDSSCQLKRSYVIDVWNMDSGIRCAFSLMMVMCAIRVTQTSQRGCVSWITSQIRKERTAEMYVTVGRWRNSPMSVSRNSMSWTEFLALLRDRVDIRMWLLSCQPWVRMDV